MGRPIISPSGVIEIQTRPPVLFSLGNEALKTVF